MRRILVFLWIVAMPAFSQWRRFGSPELEPTGWVGVGMSTPVNPLATRLNNAGWNIAGGFGFTQGYAGVMVDAMFNGFSINDTVLRREGARSGYQRYWAVTVDPVLHVNPRGPADFYITAGAGFYGQHTGLRAQSSLAGQASRYDLTRTDSTVRFGVNGGAGFAFSIDPASRLQFFIEARYHHVLSPDRGSSFIPVTVGVRF